MIRLHGRGHHRSKATALLFVLGFGLIGLEVLGLTRAATFTSSAEAEAAKRSGNAFIGSASGTSGGGYVTFGGTVASAMRIGICGHIPSYQAKMHSKLMRAEIDASPNAKGTFESLLTSSAANHVTIQPEMAWGDGSPAPDLTFLASWAKAYGPGGSFWAGKTDVYPVYNFELGNENSYYYKSGLPRDAKFQNLATVYGQRAVAAARAIDAANPQVKVLVELDTEVDNPTWVNKVLDAGGPDLIRLMRAPVAHAYGPNYQAKLDMDVKSVRARGVTTPFYLTETGFSVDNGRGLSDNYGYPSNASYATAANLFGNQLNSLAKQPDKVQVVMVYRDADIQSSGSSSSREAYFGLLRNDGSDKAGYSPVIRSIIDAHQ